MSLADMYDTGSRIKGVPAINPQTIFGTSSADPSAVNGLAIDRYATGRRFYSARSMVTTRFVGSSSQQVGTLALKFQHGDSSATFVDFSTDTTPATVTFGTTSSGGVLLTTGGIDGILEQKVNLAGAKRWVRQVITPTVATSSSGDNWALAGVLALSGAGELPSTSS